MIRILEDEAIDCFVSRLRLVSPELFRTGPWSGLNERHSDGLKLISAGLGWRGCYGFNKLLHMHTNHSVGWLLHQPTDFSFSGDLYHRSSVMIKHAEFWSIALCYGCILEDINMLGFIYWRRSHQWGGTVCARHEMKLVKHCFTCGQNFYLESLKLGRWQPCVCKEWISKDVNYLDFSLSDLSYARLWNDFSKFNFQIPVHYVSRALKERLKFMSAKSRCWSDHVTDLGAGSDTCSLHSLFIGMSEWWKSSGNDLLNSVPLIYLVHMMFNSFDDFLKAVNCPPDELVSISTKWSNYLTDV